MSLFKEKLRFNIVFNIHYSAYYGFNDCFGFFCFFQSKTIWIPVPWWCIHAKTVFNERTATSSNIFILFQDLKSILSTSVNQSAAFNMNFN